MTARETIHHATRLLELTHSVIEAFYEVCGALGYGPLGPPTNTEGTENTKMTDNTECDG